MLPAFMKSHLLTHGQLTGWDPDWYDGFPLYTFYFPLPGLITVLFNAVVSYDVAFKLVTVLGTLLLPVCAWAFGRLSGLRDPGPACLAAATLPFLFEPSFSIYGGNLLSTLAGELLLLPQPLARPPVPRRGRLGSPNRSAPGPGRRPLRLHPAVPSAPGPVRRGRRRRAGRARRRPSAWAAPQRARATGPTALGEAPALGRGGRGPRPGAGRLVAGSLRHRPGLHDQHGVDQCRGLPPPPLPRLGPVGAGRRPGRPGGHGGAPQPGGVVHRHPGGHFGGGRLPRPAGQAVQRPLPAHVVPLPLSHGGLRLGRDHLRPSPVEPAPPPDPLGPGHPGAPPAGGEGAVATGDPHQPVPSPDGGPEPPGGGGGPAHCPGRRLSGGGPAAGAAGLRPRPGGRDGGRRPAERLGCLELLRATNESPTIPSTTPSSR